MFKDLKRRLVCRNAQTDAGKTGGARACGFLKAMFEDSSL